MLDQLLAVKVRTLITRIRSHLSTLSPEEQLWFNVLLDLLDKLIRIGRSGDQAVRNYPSLPPNLKERTVVRFRTAMRHIEREREWLLEPIDKDRRTCYSCVAELLGIPEGAQRNYTALALELATMAEAAWEPLAKET